MKQFVSPDESAMYGFIILSEFDPMGNEGTAWLNRARQMLQQIEEDEMVDGQPTVKLTLAGQAGDALDIMNTTYEVFPYMLVVTMIVAMIVLGVAFKSIIIPLRSILNIGLTLGFVYGSATYVYEYGFLEWTGFYGLTGQFHGQYWMIPVICFSMVVGICLDYDIFLLSRITEKREEGLSPDEAIREGLLETGGIITAAGVIMAIAFAGMMFASMVLVNLLSFYMVCAVLYDTFVVCVLFGPAMMSLLGSYNWYPSALSVNDDDGRRRGLSDCLFEPEEGVSKPAQSSASASTNGRPSGQ
jgi:uncharacterized membrane protein YdfJ with MMPL/SSD domain